jgi:hypothetical protein
MSDERRDRCTWRKNGIAREPDSVMELSGPIPATALLADHLAVMTEPDGIAVLTSLDIGRTHVSDARVTDLASALPRLASFQ